MPMRPFDTRPPVKREPAVDKVQPVIDKKALARLEAELGAGGVVEIVMAFLQQSPERIRDMRDAAERSDLDDLFGLSHGFKPVCGMLGLNRLCQQIEALASDSHRGRAVDAVARVAAIASEYDRLTGLLYAYCEQKSQKKGPPSPSL